MILITRATVTDTSVSLLFTFKSHSQSHESLPIESRRTEVLSVLSNWRPSNMINHHPRQQLIFFNTHVQIPFCSSKKSSSSRLKLSRIEMAILGTSVVDDRIALLRRLLRFMHLPHVTSPSLYWFCDVLSQFFVLFEQARAEVRCRPLLSPTCLPQLSHSFTLFISYPTSIKSSLSRPQGSLLVHFIAKQHRITAFASLHNYPDQSSLSTILVDSPVPITPVPVTPSSVFQSSSRCIPTQLHCSWRPSVSLLPHLAPAWVPLMLLSLLKRSSTRPLDPPR